MHPCLGQSQVQMSHIFIQHFFQARAMRNRTCRFSLHRIRNPCIISDSISF